VGLEQCCLTPWTTTSFFRSTQHTTQNTTVERDDDGRMVQVLVREEESTR
jgi:hypothetical protein